ncbi:MAG: sortase domain-containing protein [Enterococcus sp.]
MKVSKKKQPIILVVIVCLLLAIVPTLFSSISDAHVLSKKDQDEQFVKIYGADTLTISPCSSFHPQQYYKAVDEKSQPLKLNYTKINTSKPGRYALVLSAKNGKDYDERTVFITVKQKKDKTSSNQKEPAPNTEEAKPETAEASKKPTQSPPVQQEEPATEKPSELQTQDEQATVETVPNERKHNEALHNETPNHKVIHNEPETTETTAPTQKIQPNQLYFHGHSLPYQNAGQGSGQGLIDSGAVIATWGGNPVQSGNDNQNTHFIGHNPGIFAPLLTLSSGDSIIVTDSGNIATTYIVQGIIQVDDSGRDIHSGQDYWDQITSTSGGERITLQTCLSETHNLIVFAQA